MSPRKKSEAKEAADAATVAFAIAAVEAKPEPDPIVEKAPVVGPPCALEGASVGTKCVVSRTDEGKFVRMLNSKDTVTLDKDDLFYTLPAGAKVRKVAEGQFEVYRLGVQEGPMFTVASARESVRRFLEVVV